MKALLVFWHGIGDLICLTPALRVLHDKGYHCDIMCLSYVIESKVLAACPYVTLRPLPTDTSPSDRGGRGKAARKLCMDAWVEIKNSYDIAFHFADKPRHIRGGKIERNLKACGLPSDTDPSLELFIPEEAEKTAKDHISENYPEGYIFQHTESERHPNHNWDPMSWISENLPDLPVFKSSYSQWNDINVAFVMASEPTHRVLISSVFVHACDAMDVVMDVVHYGVPNPHGLPLNPAKIKVTHGVMPC